MLRPVSKNGLSFGHAEISFLPLKNKISGYLRGSCILIQRKRWIEIQGGAKFHGASTLSREYCPHRTVALKGQPGRRSRCL